MREVGEGRPPRLPLSFDCMQDVIECLGDGRRHPEAGTQTDQESWDKEGRQYAFRAENGQIGHDSGRPGRIRSDRAESGQTGQKAVRS